MFSFSVCLRRSGEGLLCGGLPFRLPDVRMERMEQLQRPLWQRVQRGEGRDILVPANSLGRPCPDTMISKLQKLRNECISKISIPAGNTNYAIHKNRRMHQNQLDMHEIFTTNVPFQCIRDSHLNDCASVEEIQRDECHIICADFRWLAEGWSKCFLSDEEAECGNGTRYRSVHSSKLKSLCCLDKWTEEEVEDSRCDPLLKPSSSSSCRLIVQENVSSRCGPSLRNAQ
ncbi:hypothetical protein CEXT_59881, partial [Caerostris extrusa]